MSTPFSARTSTRRLLMLSLLAVVIGLAGGGAAWVLLHIIAMITNLALFHRTGWRLPSFRDFHPGPTLFLAAMGGALLVSLLAEWSPVIRGHGLPEAMEAILTRQSRISPRAALAKPVSAALAIGTGGPFGAEGPIIVTGGALGSLIGQLLPVSPSERKILVASGAAAGMAATFGAPLAAVVLAIELLLFEFSTRAFIPLVVAASVAGGVHAGLFGSGPLFAVPPHDYAGLARLPLYVVLGLGCGLLAVVLSKGLFLTERWFRALPVSEFWHPIIGAFGFAVVGLVVPRALGVGYDAISDTLLGRIALGSVAVLGVAKLLAWWVALASGTSGGTLAPILLIGASFGALVGHAANSVAPGLHVDPGAFALVAMAATFGAAARAPFTSIVFIFELTGNYQVILPLMLATVLADLVASGLMTESLMTEKLARRGLTVRGDYEVDVMRTTSVATIMTTAVETVPADATVGDAMDRFLASRHGAYPLVDASGACTGIVTRGDLLRQDVDCDAPVTTIATADPVSVGPKTLALDALHVMLQDGVEHLPVVADGRMVGICTRTDLLRTRLEQLEQERSQPGWHLPSLIRKARAGAATPAAATEP